MNNEDNLDKLRHNFQHKRLKRCFNTHKREIIERDAQSLLMLQKGAT